LLSSIAFQLATFKWIRVVDLAEIPPLPGAHVDWRGAIAILVKVHPAQLKKFGYYSPIRLGRVLPKLMSPEVRGLFLLGRTVSLLLPGIYYQIKKNINHGIICLFKNKFTRADIKCHSNDMAPSLENRFISGGRLSTRN